MHFFPLVPTCRRSRVFQTFLVPPRHPLEFERRPLEPSRCRRAVGGILHPMDYFFFFGKIFFNRYQIFMIKFQGLAKILNSSTCFIFDHYMLRESTQVPHKLFLFVYRAFCKIVNINIYFCKSPSPF